MENTMLFNEGDEIRLESPDFAELRDDFNVALSSTLRGMLRHESNEATVTLKLKISFRQDAVDVDIAGTKETRYATVPDFEHTVSTAITLKDKREGCLYGAGYELEHDEETGRFYRSKIRDIQVSLFDDTSEDPA